MWKNPAGYFVGCAVALNAPWSASTSTRSARMRPSRSAAILPLHQVVAGEAGRREVLRAVLHPLDRLAGDDRADDRADVAGVDRHLVAEAAADVGRDHLDLVLRQPGHDRVQRAVRVRRLRRAPEPQLAGDRVVVGDRAARLQRRRMHALERDLLGDDDDVGVREHARRSPPRRPPPSRRCGCRSGPPCRRGSPARRRRARVRGSTTTGSGSYSTSISSSASRAA